MVGKFKIGPIKDVVAASAAGLARAIAQQNPSFDADRFKLDLQALVLRHGNAAGGAKVPPATVTLSSVATTQYNVAADLLCLALHKYGEGDRKAASKLALMAFGERSMEQLADAFETINNEAEKLDQLVASERGSQRQAGLTEDFEIECAINRVAKKVKRNKRARGDMRLRKIGRLVRNQQKINDNNESPKKLVLVKRFDPDAELMTDNVVDDDCKSPSKLQKKMSKAHRVSSEEVAIANSLSWSGDDASLALANKIAVSSTGS